MSIDWTKLFKEYKGLWVALQNDEITVIASGKTAKEALVRAQKKGFDTPILTKMPQAISTYVGSLL